MRAHHALDLEGYLLLPGLINAHDHLEFALFPRLGNRTYANAHEWALDIYRPEDEPIRSLRKIDKSARLWWGGIRNLLSGVTTVCHHNEYAPVFDDHFPVRVLRNYGWAHSFAFEEEIQARARARSTEEPFFIHLGEGTDAEAEAELWELDRLGLLNAHTVLIHALAIGQTRPGTGAFTRGIYRLVPEFEFVSVRQDTGSRIHRCVSFLRPWQRFAPDQRGRFAG